MLRKIFYLSALLALSACGGEKSSDGSVNQNSLDNKSEIELKELDKIYPLDDLPSEIVDSVNCQNAEAVLRDNVQKPVYFKYSSDSVGNLLYNMRPSKACSEDPKFNNIKGVCVSSDTPASLELNDSSLVIRMDMEGCSYKTEISNAKEGFVTGVTSSNESCRYPASGKAEKLLICKRGNANSDVGVVTPVSVPSASSAPLEKQNAASKAKQANCNVSNSYGESYKATCKFTMYENGSFTIEPSKQGDLILGSDMVSVWITEPGFAEVQGATPEGGNSRWGEARRSAQNRACWVGSDFRICVN